jgi:hypothetical protein
MSAAATPAMLSVSFGAGLGRKPAWCGVEVVPGFVELEVAVPA